MFCANDLSQLRLQGGLFGDVNSIVNIKLARCIGQSHCKSEKEIDTLIDRLALLYLYNTQTYSPN